MSAIKTVNMHDAKSSLSKLVEEALSGREIVLARAGKPVVRLIPVSAAKRRKLGQWKGKVRMSDDFDCPLTAKELTAWQGKAQK